MKLEKRYVIGIGLLILFLPVFVLGFIGYWLHLYVQSGYDEGEVVYEWIMEKTRTKSEQQTIDEDW